MRIRRERDLIELGPKSICARGPKQRRGLVLLSRSDLGLAETAGGVSDDLVLSNKVICAQITTTCDDTLMTRLFHPCGQKSQPTRLHRVMGSRLQRTEPGSRTRQLSSRSRQAAQPTVAACRLTNREPTRLTNALPTLTVDGCHSSPEVTMQSTGFSVK